RDPGGRADWGQGDAPDGREGRRAPDGGEEGAHAPVAAPRDDAARRGRVYPLPVGADGQGTSGRGEGRGSVRGVRMNVGKTLALGFVGMVLFWLAFLSIGGVLQVRQDLERA